jgi:hypothetical protein
MPVWGLGRVLVVAGDSARVLFRDAGEKHVSLRHVALELVIGDEARDAYLDLPPSQVRRKRFAVRDFDSLVSDFLKRFPLGFRDATYVKQERAYKVKASGLCESLLAQSELETLIKSRREDEIVARAMKVLNATNLVFPNEKMSLRDGFPERTAVDAFAASLADLLYGAEDPGIRFDNFAGLLHRMGAAKWPIATYFQFLRFPEKCIFVKPQVTADAADRCGFDIAYRPELNWPTYWKVTAFAEHLKTQIASLQPKDMIDVQSFIWVCGGGYE